MARQPVERELQHDFGRARRPGPLAFDIVEAFEETANIEQQPAEFGPGRLERLMHALARGDHSLGEACGALPPRRGAEVSGSPSSRSYAASCGRR